MTWVSNGQVITGGGVSVSPYASAPETDALRKHTDGWINVRTYGAVGNGVTDDTAAIQTALSTGAKYVYFPDGSYLTTSKLTTLVGQTLRGSGRRTARLIKGGNGYLANAAGWTVIEDLGFVGARASFTGGGIEISTGDNTPTVANQGHQRISRCGFEEFDGYAVDYTTANKGWMSRVEKCTFTNTNADASIKWPDEPSSGGNRYAIDNYSGPAIVNVGGADNGLIQANVVGGISSTNQGVVFPAGTTNKAKKLQVIGNRFAIGGGTLNIRGSEGIFTDNEIAGNVVFESHASSDGAAATVWRNNVIAGGYTLTDSSGTSNAIAVVDWQAFTPTWTTTGTAPALGNADVRCEWRREGAYVHAKYWITFGTTSTYGTGLWKFSLPVGRYTSTTTDFVGTAYLHGQMGVVRTLYSASENNVQITTYSGSAVNATTPITWASGNLLMIDLVYRIF